MIIPHFVYLQLLVDIWVGSSFGLLKIKLLWICVCKSLCGHTLLFLFGKYLWVNTFGYMVVYNFKKKIHTVFKVIEPFYSSTSSILRVPVVPYLYQHLVWSVFWNFSFSSSWMRCFNVILIYIFLVTNDVEYLVFLLAICVASLVQCPNLLPIFY